MSKNFSYIFGPDSSGNTEKERARTSKFEFVRSQDHLALAKDTSRGRRLTAYEAYVSYGLSKLEEVADRGSAVLVSSLEEPAQTIRTRRQALGIKSIDISKATGLSESDVLDCENINTRTSIRKIEKVAMALGLDERQLAVSRGAGGDPKLAFRLKELGGSANISPAVVLTLTEAAWVIETQIRLLHEISRAPTIYKNFVPSNNYGDANYPAWKQGYFLADQARSILGIQADEPIPSLRKVCNQLGIPLVQAKLPRSIAGATISNGQTRGIVVNTEGFNANVFVRRATIAHELGHVLWDPEQKLESIRVDEYTELEQHSSQNSDFVEARANAFAIAFLAPPAAVAKEYMHQADSINNLEKLMNIFGISYSATKHHITNVVDAAHIADRLVDTEPPADWKGRESFTDDFFPFKETPAARRGEFAGIVIEAQTKGIISEDTAAQYLCVDINEYKLHSESIFSLFQATD